MTQKKIIEKLHLAFADVDNIAHQFPEDNFFQRPANGKWSAAENVEHLFLSVMPLAGLFCNPALMLEKWGKSERISEDYDKVVAIYQEKIGTIRGAVPGFIPEAIVASRQELIQNLKAVNTKFLLRASLFTEEELDIFQVPHPLIGLLTCREFLYFTHYH